MSTTHTPGPWRVTGPNIRAGDALVAVAENLWADMVCPEEEKSANARLIAAAPELLIALQHVLDRATMPGFLRDEVKAAITKATGG